MKSIISLSVLIMSFTFCFGQNHDSAVMNQITLEELGVGAPGGTNVAARAEYLTHKEYTYEALYNPAWKKYGQRYLTSKALMSQMRAASRIDSAFTSRAKEEALDLADRELDAVWIFEKDKINSSLEKWEKNINKITPNGGTLLEYRQWRTAFEGIKAAIEGVKKSHLGNSQRQECYTLIYKDIESKNLTLVACLNGWMSQRTAKELMKSSSSPVKPVSRKNVAAVCYARWKAVIAESSGVGR